MLDETYFTQDDFSAWKDEIASCKKIKKRNEDEEDFEIPDFPFPSETDNYTNELLETETIPNYGHINVETLYDAPIEKTVYDTSKNHKDDFKSINFQSINFQTALNQKGLDRNTEKKLKSGNYPIDATLDLHGMFLEEAREKLESFLHSSINQGLRCLLVITGKGSHSDSNAITIKSKLCEWLYHSNYSGDIVRCISASAKHGGSGAFYVLLKRKKVIFDD